MQYRLSEFFSGGSPLCYLPNLVNVICELPLVPKSRATSNVTLQVKNDAFSFVIETANFSAPESETGPLRHLDRYFDLASLHSIQFINFYQ